MSGGESKEGLIPLEFNGKTYFPASGNHWKISVDELKIVGNKGRLFPVGNTMTFKKYLDEAPYTSLKNVWLDTMESTYAVQRMYVVQTAERVIQRCILMTTDPGDLVFDPTCGSGTTAKVSEEYGRRWITCDTSRISLNIAKKRLMSSNFMYFNLAHPNEGVGSGFIYETIPIITLKSVAIGDSIPQENLIDRPKINNSLCRVTGPFTVEAVPAPVTKSFSEFPIENMLDADKSISRSGETLRQEEWRNELLRTGVRAKGGKMIEFTRVEPLSGTRFLQAEAETKVAMPNVNLFEKKQPTLMEQPKRVVVCFGPEHAPLEQRMVELALEEARNLRPQPEIVLFCAFHFDPEARKDIEETNWPGITLLEAQMNADLLTDDLKKKRSSNESFWLIGQPDVTLKELKSGEDKGKYLIEVNGFDYYNPRTGTVDSGGKGDIAMWMLDHNYDGRSLFPSQVFFPMAGSKEGWATLAKNLKAEIDEEKIEAFGGTVSLPFIPGQEIAVKIIDARGIESLKIIRL
jgi:adenine-specific DNA-methyltransferase